MSPRTDNRSPRVEARGLVSRGVEAIGGAPNGGASLLPACDSNAGPKCSPLHVFTVKLARDHLHTLRNGECRGAGPLAGSVRACPESIEGVSLTNRDVRAGGWEMSTFAEE